MDLESYFIKGQKQLDQSISKRGKEHQYYSVRYISYLCYRRRADSKQRYLNYGSEGSKYRSRPWTKAMALRITIRRLEIFTNRCSFDNKFITNSCETPPQLVKKELGVKERSVGAVAALALLMGCTLAACGSTPTAVSPTSSVQVSKSDAAKPSNSVTASQSSQSGVSQASVNTTAASPTTTSSASSASSASATSASAPTSSASSQSAIQNAMSSIDSQLAKLNSNIVTGNSEVNNSGSGS